MNDIYICLSRANNGFGMAVVGCPPGGNPLGYLTNWFADNRFKNPRRQVALYEVAGRLEGATALEGVITVAEHFDQETVVGGIPWTT